MKTIVRPGTTPRRTRTCFFCSCEFMYDEADIEFKPDAEACRGTGLKPCKIVTCPQCGRINVLWNPNMPKDKYTEPVECEDDGTTDSPYYIEPTEDEEESE